MAEHSTRRPDEAGPPHDLHEEWLGTSARRGVPDDVVEQVAHVLDLDSHGFVVLEGLQRLRDPHGKSFFVLPRAVDAATARRAALLTFVLNAGTDYGTDARGRRVVTDFEPVQFSVEEVRRVGRRQSANAWSYREDVGFAHRGGARLVTTPYGILMGLGGDPLLRLLSQRGGTSWGDVFLLNAGRVADPVALLDAVVASGVAPRREAQGRETRGRETRGRETRGRETRGRGAVVRPDGLDLDRLLHHEERHSRQWAEHGHARFVARYLWEQLRRRDDTERDAGLADGGYRVAGRGPRGTVRGPD